MHFEFLPVFKWSDLALFAFLSIIALATVVKLIHFATKPERSSAPDGAGTMGEVNPYSNMTDEQLEPILRKSPDVFKAYRTRRYREIHQMVLSVVTDKQEAHDITRSAFHGLEQYLRQETQFEAPANVILLRVIKRNMRPYVVDQPYRDLIDSDLDPEEMDKALRARAWRDLEYDELVAVLFRDNGNARADIALAMNVPLRTLTALLDAADGKIFESLTRLKTG